MRFSFIGAVALAAWCACGRDSRLADKKLRKIETAKVELYGMTLDQQSPPEQVAFAALQAVREDFYAKNKTEREAALDKQFALAAGKTIAGRDRTSLTAEEVTYHVVYHWTPTLSHYAANFPTTWDEAKSRLVVRKVGPGKNSKISEAEVALQVADPSGDPKASVVLLTWLAQEEGYWRVLHFGFDSRKRTLVAAGTTEENE